MTTTLTKPVPSLIGGLSPTTSTEIPESPFSPIGDIIADIRAGKMVIVVDDEDRENEGDLIAAAELITPEMVDFMLKQRGLLCVSVTEEIADRLDLPAMVSTNRDSFQTDFRVTVDAAQGVTTGISTADRATTIRLLGNPLTSSEDLVRPGHIQPLRARNGGVLRRAGHTEASVDLARMAGLQPAGVLIEIMKEDAGSMARLPDLLKLAAKHDLKICSIESIISYRREREKLVEKLEVVRLPTDFGDFDLHMYKTSLNDDIHLALVKGKIQTDEPTLVRVHSECLTGDVFGSQRCDCGVQLRDAMQRIEREGAGVLLYMRQEGRGIGLEGKIRAYKLQEGGMDTVEANEKLGYPSDLRDYGMGAQILHDLGVRQVRLMTNNPKKLIGLEGHHLKIVEQVPIHSAPNEHNRNYLETKRKKMGHSLFPIPQKS